MVLRYVRPVVLTEWTPIQMPSNLAGNTTQDMSSVSQLPELSLEVGNILFASHGLQLPDLDPRSMPAASRIPGQQGSAQQQQNLEFILM